jgi:DNA-binding SARP family transcriptional activator
MAAATLARLLPGDASAMLPAATRTDIRLRLLGGFELTIDGSPVLLRPESQRLLAYVAITSRGVERSFAAFQLWPDTNERRARANLRSALWRLGRVASNLVATTATRLRLDDSVWVDAKHGIAELSSVDSTTLVESQLPFEWMGADLLPDWYDDWLMIERERLRQLHVRLLEGRARESLNAGATAEAIQFALAAVSVDPLRESGHRLVIEAHLAEGNSHEAQRQLQAFQDVRAHAQSAPSLALLAFAGSAG